MKPYVEIGPIEIFAALITIVAILCLLFLPHPSDGPHPPYQCNQGTYVNNTIGEHCDLPTQHVVLQKTINTTYGINYDMEKLFNLTNQETILSSNNVTNCVLAVGQVTNINLSTNHTTKYLLGNSLGDPQDPFFGLSLFEYKNNPNETITITIKYDITWQRSLWQPLPNAQEGNEYNLCRKAVLQAGGEGT